MHIDTYLYRYRSMGAYIPVHINLPARSCGYMHAYVYIPTYIDLHT